jgi:hypothetical protein
MLAESRFLRRKLVRHPVDAGFNVSAEQAREMASRADGYLPSCQRRGRRAGLKLTQSAGIVTSPLGLPSLTFSRNHR